MSPEAQRIAIAKSVSIHLHDGDHAPSSYTFVSDLPDYLNDYDELHGVLLTLPDNDDFTAHLDQFIYEDNRRLVSKMDRVRATTKQLAKAYLVTIGKWEGGSDEPQG
jgi:hypothetical protein